MSYSRMRPGQPGLPEGQVALLAHGQYNPDREPLEHAVGVLGQQAWCWGRDILRPEGNWLLELGFERVEPPAEHRGCSSVYSLELPRGRCVVLRGFGVFYGDRKHGGVFLPRFEFSPRYTTDATLRCPPWTEADLSGLRPPTDSQRNLCVSLTLDLIGWIRDYEVNVVERLGIEYRRSTLVQWNNGKRPFTPAECFSSEWRALANAFAGAPSLLFRKHEEEGSS